VLLPLLPKASGFSRSAGQLVTILLGSLGGAFGAGVALELGIHAARRW
jgi:hypothetical protein